MQVGIQLLLPAADAPAAGSEQSQDGCVAASAPAGRRPLSGGAAADAAVVALRQAIALGLLLLCSQVQQLVEAFTVRAWRPLASMRVCVLTRSQHPHTPDRPPGASWL
jgi:hypothetical protein